MNAISPNVDQLVDLPAALFELAKTAREAGVFIASADRCIRENFDVFDWLERKSINIGFDFTNSLLTVSFTGDGPMLAEFWSLLRRAGYHTENRPKQGDTSYYGWWSKTGSLGIVLSFSSSVCRRVQTGTRTVTREEPIYKTICGDQLAIPEESALIELSTPADDDIPF